MKITKEQLQAQIDAEVAKQLRSKAAREIVFKTAPKEPDSVSKRVAKALDGQNTDSQAVATTKSKSGGISAAIKAAGTFGKRDSKTLKHETAKVEKAEVESPAATLAKLRTAGFTSAADAASGLQVTRLPRNPTSAELDEAANAIGKTSFHNLDQDSQVRAVMQANRKIINGGK